AAAHCELEPPPLLLLLLLLLSVDWVAGVAEVAGGDSLTYVRRACGVAEVAGVAGAYSFARKSSGSLLTLMLSVFARPACGELHVSGSGRFGGKIRIEPLPDGGLMAHWNEHTSALLRSAGTCGSGGLLHEYPQEEGAA